MGHWFGRRDYAVVFLIRLYALKYAGGTDAFWDVTTEVAHAAGPWSDIGRFSSLGVDSEGTLCATYYDAGEDCLRFAQLLTGGWVSEIVDDDGDVGQHTSLAVDGSGGLHAVYYDVDRGALRYAGGRAAFWEIAVEVAHPAGPWQDLGQYSSAVWDEIANVLCVSYYDAGENQLIHAYQDGGGWAREVLDSGGQENADVGLYAAMCLRPDRTRHISYFDTSNHSLKIASGHPMYDSTVAIASAVAHTYDYWPGETASVDITVHSTWTARAEYDLDVVLQSSVGESFDLGSYPVSLEPGGQQVVTVNWVITSSDAPRWFAVEASLRQDGSLMDHANFANVFATVPVEQEIIELAHETISNCLDPAVACAVSWGTAVPYVGVATDVMLYADAACNFQEHLDNGEPGRAAISGIGGLIGGLSLTVRTAAALVSGGGTEVAVPAWHTMTLGAVNVFFACVDVLFFTEDQRVGRDPTAATAIDTLAMEIDLSLAELAIPFTNEVLLAGRATLRAGFDAAHLCDMDSIRTTEVLAFPVGESDISWWHIGPQPLPIGVQDAANPLNHVELKFICTEADTLEFGLLHRGASDRVEWLRYPPIVLEPGGIGSVAVSDTTTIFALDVDTDGDGTIDITLLPDCATAVDDRGLVAARFTLHGAHPNPFNPATTIAFDLPSATATTITIYDLAGRRVKTLFSNQPFPAGRSEVRWFGDDDHGAPVASGVYLCRVSAGRDRASTKLMMLK